MIKFNQVGGPRNILVVCDFPKKAKELFDRWCEAMYKNGVRFRTMSDILTIDVVGGNSFKFVHGTYAEEKTRGWTGLVISGAEFEKHVERIVNYDM